MQVCFFEDGHTSRFYPLTLTRPVDDLRIGILTIREKWNKRLESTNTTRITRGELSELFFSGGIDPSEPCLWINSRIIPDEAILEMIDDLDPGSLLSHSENVLAACADGKTSAEWHRNGKPDFSSLMVIEAESYSSIEHLWDLFLLNGQEIINDFELHGQTSSGDYEISKQAVLEPEEQIKIGAGTVIEPGAVLNAHGGPIFIGEDCTIQAGAMIRGPVAVCNGSTIKMGAKIYGETTVGPVCKVGGEVNNSIFHSYSNKAHDGFVGNSIIGQWCNLGADTNTSNLKNNYSTIRLTDWETRDPIDTGRQFIGTIMGDHTKTAINTQLNTGTLCGVSCNIFSSDFPPKLLPSFSWVGTNVIQPYRFDDAVETMEAMMQRRDVSLSDEYRSLMKYIFENRRE